MSLDPNSLNNKGFHAVPGRSILLFLVLLPAIVFLALRLWPDRAMLSVMGVVFASAVVATGLAVAPLGRSALSALALRPVGWRPLVFGALGTLAVSVVVSQIGIEPQGIKDAMKVALAPGRLAMSLLLLGIVAPLAEELVFRGLLYGWVEGRWGGRPALIVSSLAFAAAHYEPAHILLVLPLGFLFGWLRWHTGSLVPSLVAHAANNSFAVAAASLLKV